MFLLVGTAVVLVCVLGGYVAGTRSLVEFLYHRARPFLFSTSHPPAVAAACIAAIDVLLDEPQVIEHLWANTRFFQTGLNALGFNTGASEGPITPVIVGDGALAMTLSRDASPSAHGTCALMPVGCSTTSLSWRRARGTGRRPAQRWPVRRGCAVRRAQPPWCASRIF